MSEELCCEAYGRSRRGHGPDCPTLHQAAVETAAGIGTCKFPGCPNPSRPRKDPRARRPRYCDQHNNSTAWTRAWRARRKREKEEQQ
jgi:hypothetical protein